MHPPTGCQGSPACNGAPSPPPDGFLPFTIPELPSPRRWGRRHGHGRAGNGRWWPSWTTAHSLLWRRSLLCGEDPPLRPPGGHPPRRCRRRRHHLTSRPPTSPPLAARARRCRAAPPPHGTASSTAVQPTSPPTPLFRTAPHQAQRDTHDGRVGRQAGARASERASARHAPLGGAPKSPRHPSTPPHSRCRRRRAVTGRPARPRAELAACTGGGRGGREG